MGTGDILPLPSMTVQKRVVLGCPVAVVTVEPSLGYAGTVQWPRVGPGRAVRSRRIRGRRTSARRASARCGSSVRHEARWWRQALRTSIWISCATNICPTPSRRKYWSGMKDPPKHQLRSLRLTQSGSPTWGAVLALGRDPQAFMPGAYVQFLRIDGAEITDPIRDQKQLTGRLDDVVRRLDELLRTERLGSNPGRWVSRARSAGLTILLMRCANSLTTR